MSEQQHGDGERPETVHLVSTAGHPNYGDELVAAAWLRFLAERRPDADVILDCPDPGLASFLFEDINPRAKFTNLLWRVSWETMQLDADAAAAHVDRTVTDLGTPLYDLGLLALRRATTVHLVGGGHFGAHWPHHLWVVHAARRLAEVSGARLVATGLGLTPPSDADRLREDLGACAHLGVRDRPSAELVGVEPGVNDAFLELPRLPGFGVRPDSTGRPGEVWISLQRDLMDEDGLEAMVAQVRALIESGRFEGRELRYLEALPGRDRDAYDLLADLIPEDNFMPFVRLWHEGFPARPLQTWITTRYHFHQLAAALGADGIVVGIDDEYHRTKHESLLALGTGFAYAEPGAADLPAPSGNPDFRLQAGRLQRAKREEAEALYPRR